MNSLTLITLFSAVCSILSFFTSEKIKSRWAWVIIVFILTFSSGCAVYYNSELERINNIHRQAMAISEQYNPPFGSEREFIQEVMVFLEENRDRYPESYERAKSIYSEMKKSENQYDSYTASEFRGIIKAIATLNKE